jgi:iron complex transport system substrate-binding protein
VSSNEVIERRPDVIVASWCGKPFERAALERGAGWEKIPAVRDGEIYELPGAIILQPGPACLTDGLDALEQLILDWSERR